MVFLGENAPDDVAGHCTIAAAPLVSVLRARVQTRPGGQTSGGAGRDCSTCRAVCDSCKRCTHWCTLYTLCTHWSTPAKLLSRKVLLHAVAASPAASQTRKNCTIFHFEIIFFIYICGWCSTLASSEYFPACADWKVCKDFLYSHTVDSTLALDLLSVLNL